MKRPGMSSFFAIACLASVTSQGKNWRALISRVTGELSSNRVESAFFPTTFFRKSATETNAPRSRSRVSHSRSAR